MSLELTAIETEEILCQHPDGFSAVTQVVFLDLTVEDRGPGVLYDQDDPPILHKEELVLSLN